MRLAPWLTLSVLSGLVASCAGGPATLPPRDPARTPATLGHAPRVLVLVGGFDALECLPLGILGPVAVERGGAESFIAGAGGRRWDVLLVDCGMIWAGPPDQSLVAALRTFVARGGRVMATDLAYPLVEHAWPDLIDFAGTGAAAGAPQPAGAAAHGPEGDVLGTVVDEGLARHLGTRRFVARDQQPDWAMVRSVSADARVFARRDDAHGGHPLAVAADFPGGGRVVYASFHGHARDADPDACGPPTGEASERALVYMIAYALGAASAAAPPRPATARPPPESARPEVPMPVILDDPGMEVEGIPAAKDKGRHRSP